MSYLGICDKYGMDRALIAAYSIPMPISILANAAFGHTTDLAPVSLFCSIVAGFSGFVAGSLMHDAADVYLHKKKFGVNRGSVLLQKAQALSYAFVAATALGGSVLYMDGFDSEEQGRTKDPAPVEEIIKRDERAIPLVLKHNAQNYPAA